MIRSFHSSLSSAPPVTYWPALLARSKGSTNGKGARRNHDVDRPDFGYMPEERVSTRYGVTGQFVEEAIVSNSLENGGSFNFMPQ